MGELFVKNSTRSFVETHIEFKSFEKGNKPFGEKLIMSYQVDKQDVKYITSTYSVYKIVKVYQPMKGTIKLYDTPDKILENQQLVAYILSQPNNTHQQQPSKFENTISYSQNKNQAIININALYNEQPRMTNSINHSNEVNINEIGDDKAFNKKVAEMKEDYNSLMAKVAEIEKSINEDEELTSAERYFVI